MNYIILINKQKNEERGSISITNKKKAKLGLTSSFKKTNPEDHKNREENRVFKDMGRMLHSFKRDYGSVFSTNDII